MRDRRFQDLCKKTLEELFGEHACMAFDRDLMMRTAVKHKIVVDEEDGFGAKPNLREFVRDAIREQDRIRFMAGYVDQFEKAEHIHSEYAEMVARAKSVRTARQQLAGL